jgi:hypothetical protein
MATVDIPKIRRDREATSVFASPKSPYNYPIVFIEKIIKSIYNIL